MSHASYKYGARIQVASFGQQRSAKTAKEAAILLLGYDMGKEEHLHKAFNLAGSAALPFDWVDVDEDLKFVAAAIIRHRHDLPQWQRKTGKSMCRTLKSLQSDVGIIQVISNPIGQGSCGANQRSAYLRSLIVDGLDILEEGCQLYPCMSATWPLEAHQYLSSHRGR